MEPPKHRICSYKGNQPGHVCSFIIKGAFAENQNPSFSSLTRKWGLGFYHNKYSTQSNPERFGLATHYAPSVAPAGLGPLSGVTLLVLGDSSQVESAPQGAFLPQDGLGLPVCVLHSGPDLIFLWPGSSTWHEV